MPGTYTLHYITLENYSGLSKSNFKDTTATTLYNIVWVGLSK